MACRGLALLLVDCVAWILGRTADGPPNVFEELAGLSPLPTGREPPFEAALDWLQFAYTADRAGAYVAPASTVLVQYAVSEGDDLLAALLAHLRRQYPEVYGLGLDTARAHECREIILGEGKGMSGVNSSVNSSIKLGAYTGRLDNLNLAGINNPSPNLTTVYLDTPLVGPTPKPLKYVPLLGRIGQPSGYPPSITRTSVGGAHRRPHPPPPPHNHHPRMLPSTGRVQPRRLLQATGPGKMRKFWPRGRNPSRNFGPKGWRVLPPQERQRALKIWVLENRGEPLVEF